MSKKMTGDERHALIIKTLTESDQPVTGATFAEIANVSRQVIVQDVSILKAKGEPIVATSQGYIYMAVSKETEYMQHIVACQHTPDETRDELYMIVDHGVTVKDITIEHPVYGDLTASIMVSNRSEVDQFVSKIEANNTSYLAPLTEGIHLHTLEADTEKKIRSACDALAAAGMLVDE